MFVKYKYKLKPIPIIARNAFKLVNIYVLYKIKKLGTILYYVQLKLIV